MSRHIYWLLISIILLMISVILTVGCTGDRAQNPTLVTINVEPGVVEISGGYRQGITAQRSLVITSSDDDDMYYEISSDAPWLTAFRPSSGKVPDTIFFEANALTLPPGTYFDSIKVESATASNSPVWVPIAFTVNPVVIAQPSVMHFLAIPGTPPPDSVPLALSTASGIPLEYSTRWLADWLHLSKTSGSFPDTIWISIDHSAVEPGRYSDYISISTDMADIDPVFVLCSLRVASWLEQENDVKQDLAGVDFVDASHGWAVGALGLSSEGGYIIRTTDAGETWDKVNLAIEQLGSVDFVSQTLGWVAGIGGLVERSDDGGITWQALPTGFTNDLRDIQFIDQSRGWAVGDSGIIAFTDDGGDSWVVQDSGGGFPLSAVHFIDANIGWAVGDFGLIRHTSDGGKNWITEDAGSRIDLWGVAFGDVNGWAVGKFGKILYKENVDADWVQQYQHSGQQRLNSVFADSDLEAWAVGEGGLVLHTFDGGLTWSEQPTGTTRDLWGVSFVGNLNGWVVGRLGSIFRTTNGGE